MLKIPLWDVWVAINFIHSEISETNKINSQMSTKEKLIHCPYEQLAPIGNINNKSLTHQVKCENWSTPHISSCSVLIRQGHNGTASTIDCENWNTGSYHLQCIMLLQANDTKRHISVGRFYSPIISIIINNNKKNTMTHSLSITASCLICILPVKYICKHGK